jgi:hypothetical protein
MTKALSVVVIVLASASLIAQSKQPDWTQIEPEALKHFQAIVKMDTTDPPGGEKPVVDYLKQVLDAEGIATLMTVLTLKRFHVPLDRDVIALFECGE